MKALQPSRSSCRNPAPARAIDRRGSARGGRALVAYEPASTSRADPVPTGRDDRPADRSADRERGVACDGEEPVGLLQLLLRHDLPHEPVRRGRVEAPRRLRRTPGGRSAPTWRGRETRSPGRTQSGAATSEPTSRAAGTRSPRRRGTRASPRAPASGGDARPRPRSRRRRCRGSRTPRRSARGTSRRTRSPGLRTGRRKSRRRSGPAWCDALRGVTRALASPPSARGRGTTATAASHASIRVGVVVRESASSASAYSTNSSSVAPPSTDSAQSRRLQVAARRGAADVVGDAEVDEREPFGAASLDLVERLLPRLDVDVGRRRRRHDEAAGQHAHAARVAGVERPVGVEVADVVRRVAGRGERLEPETGAVERVDVLLRHRRELAPERVEGVAVQPARALLQPLGVDEVRRADRRDVHLQAGCLRTRTPAAPAWSRWMCVSRRWRTSVSARPRAARPASSASTLVVGPQSRSAGPSVVSRR